MGDLQQLRDAAHAVTVAREAWDAAWDLAAERQAWYDAEVVRLCALLRGVTAAPAPSPSLLGLLETPLDPAAVTITETMGEALRLRLAALHILVDREDIATWSLQEYDAVMTYLARVASGTIIDPATRPAVLPRVGVPPYLSDLLRRLRQLGVAVDLQAVCAWTREERAQAAIWAAQVAGHVHAPVDRPPHVPAPAVSV